MTFEILVDLSMKLRKRSRLVSQDSAEHSLDVEDISNFKQDSDSNSSSQFEEETRRAPKRNAGFVNSEDSEVCDSEYWADKYSHIEAQTGQVVSKRKLQDVGKWLKNALDDSGSRLLVLCGPPGCGKSSALRIAGKEMQCTISSWNAPDVSSRGISGTLLEDFQNFFVGAKYCSLTAVEEGEGRAEALGTHRKLLLIDDLPLGFREMEQNVDILRDIFSHAAKFSPHPLALIISANEKGINRLSRILLGPELLSSPFVSTIKVPAVTDIMAKRRLNEILQRERFLMSSNDIARIIERSKGDIRTALNDLQLSCCHNVEGGTKRFKADRMGSSNVRRKRPARRKRTPLASLGRDVTLNSYHAVSKILNNKRTETGASKYDVEELLNEAQVEPASFLSFLHQNCLDFFGNIDDIADAFSCLSDSDRLSRWQQDSGFRTDSNNCAASVGTRGFLIFNRNPIRKGWRPIRASDSYEVSREARSATKATHRRLEVVQRPASSTTYELLENIPYANIIFQSREGNFQPPQAAEAQYMQPFSRTRAPGPADEMLGGAGSSLDGKRPGDEMEEIQEWDD